jgi:hypothetical protein
VFRQGDSSSLIGPGGPSPLRVLTCLNSVDILCGSSVHDSSATNSFSYGGIKLLRYEN